MKTIIRQIVKIIATDSELKAMCITNKGNAVSLVINLNNKPELKKIVDDCAFKLLDHLEKELE